MTPLATRIDEARAVGSNAVPILMAELADERACAAWAERQRLVLVVKRLAMAWTRNGRPGAAGVALEIARELEQEPR
jgi:hypothetical protein